MNAALRRFGFPVHPVDSYRYFVGDSVVSMVERSLPAQSRNQQTIEKCRLALTEEYHRRWVNNTKPYPGIPELLSELEKQKIPKAVLSNKPHEFTVPMVEKMLPGFSFDVVLGVSEVVKRKPDPSAALLIAERLGVPPTKILYLGDTNTDMQTAAAAGMFPVGACGASGTKRSWLKTVRRPSQKSPSMSSKFLTDRIQKPEVRAA